MEIAVIVDGISPAQRDFYPWFRYAAQLGEHGWQLHFFEGETLPTAFERRFDAMMLHVWLDWLNPKLFEPRRTMRTLERYAVYRAEYPETVQIILNHTDMSRRPYATIYWRRGDPVLYRTPAYDRAELDPFPAETIWPFEKVWGAPVFASAAEDLPYAAGFIGRISGPKGYRERVARETAKVGLGICSSERPYSKQEYSQLMARCRIAVCPRGWGEQSARHWDAWRSGKPVLTDRDCDAVEMIPGLRLQAGVHYLIFEEPEQIPDLVRYWTAPARAEALAEIGRQGQRAAESYDPLDNLLRFFRHALASER
ncbi:MAG TPA: glycosyltransferase [Terriglobales bacterium]|nr:glycosyltransferase [Terriglobales bacterium]